MWDVMCKLKAFHLKFLYYTLYEVQWFRCLFSASGAIFGNCMYVATAVMWDFHLITCSFLSIPRGQL